MPGFPLAALGAGLGQWAQYAQQQQAQRERQQMLQMQLANFAQQMQDRQQERQSANSLWGADIGSGTQIKPVGTPISTPQTSTPPAQSGGPSDPAALVRKYESGGNYNVGFGGADLSNAPRDETGFPQWAGKQGPSGISHAAGAYQFQPGTWKQYAGPLGVHDFSPASQDAVFNAARADQGMKPWAPFNPRLAAALKSGEGAETTPTAPSETQVADASGGDASTTSTGPVPIPDLRKRLNAIIPPDLNGRMSEAALKAKIDQACPTCPAIYKLKYLDSELKRLAPAEAERVKAAHDNYKTQIDAETKMWEEEVKRQDKTQDRATSSSGQIFESGPDKPLMTVDPNHPEKGARPIAGSEGLRRPGGTGPKTSHNVEVTDAEGKVIFSGSARQGPQGWVSDKDGQAIAVPDAGNIKILGVGGQGRAAAAQIQSMIGASSELVGEAKNLMELPSTATAGVFQGLQGIPANQLGDALKRTLANKLTPEESTDMATSFQGVARSLATIEAQGRATGLVGLTGMSAGLMPQSNDTLGNIWRKYATLRQIMERNIDAIEASPNANAEQKGLLKKLREEMAGVIPFTVSDVNKMQHGDAESFSQAAKKAGLGGGGSVVSGPQEGQTATNPQTGAKLIFRGGRWSPVQ